MRYNSSVLAYIALLGVLSLCTTTWSDVVSDSFAEPLPEYSPVPIWWWSGDPVEPDRVREQVARMAEGGIRNAIILNLAPSGPLYGSRPDEPPFLTDQWWDLFAVALEAGKQAGVRLWFYDQLGFSGAGLQARVVRDNGAYRGISLNRVVKDVEGPATVEMATPPGGTALTAFSAHLADPEQSDLHWIWDQAVTDEKATRYFRRSFNLDAVPAQARINITADNGYMLYINGKEIGAELVFDSSGWSQAEQYDVLPYLRKGENVIAVQADKLGGSAGFAVELLFSPAAERVPGAPANILTDAAWRMSDRAPGRWKEPGFNDAAWRQADVVGPMGAQPWGDVGGFETGAGHGLGSRLQYVRDVTFGIKDGILKVDVPEGRQRVQLFYTTPGGFDYQNPEGCAALLDVVHGEMARRFPDELGKAIAGSFQDEFPALPRFSARLADEFEKRKGYSLLKRLPALYDDVVDTFGEPGGPPTIRIRCDANDVAAELCEEAFFKPLYEWHEKFGMLCGYDQTVRNADPIRGEAYYVDYFKTMRHYSAPGNDMDGDMKPHQSIAELYDRPRVWLEGFHSSGWGQTPEDIAAVMRPWLVEGASLFDPHAIYYSIHGSYWEWAPPDTGWRQPYFVHYKTLADYSARLCHIMSQGRLVTDIALLHPATTVHAYTGFGEPGGPARKASDCYWKVQTALRQARIDYLIGDEDSVAAGTVENGALRMGRAEVRMVVLPQAIVLTAPVLRQLGKLAGAGGIIMVVGSPPEAAAGPLAEGETLHGLLDSLLKGAVRLDDPAQAPGAIEYRLQRDLVERLPYTHRRIGDRDFYYVLSEDRVLANGGARYEVNKFDLWNTPAARCERLSFTAAVDGIPELWMASDGARIPLNYRRTEGKTRVDISLHDSPAPLVAFRMPTPEDPIAIESDLWVREYRRDGDSVGVTGLYLPDKSVPVPTEHRVRVEFADAAFEGLQPTDLLEILSLQEPFGCAMVPTCSNDDGSFSWPPSDGPVPVETRSFRYHAEAPGEDPAVLAKPDLDDSSWPTAIASFGPRAQAVKVAEGVAPADFAAMGRPDEPGAMTPVVYSPRLGINEDPVFAAALGGKGRIPEDFVDLGTAEAGAVYLVRVMVTVPAGAGEVESVLRVGGSALKRVFLNGSKVDFGGAPATRKQRASVRLHEGPNALEILAMREARGAMRLFYQFLPPAGAPPDPEWIWSAATPESGRSVFMRAIEVPGPVASAAMVAALGDLHQIRINGKLLADQGNFDPYFTSRAERYDIAGFIQPGTNTIEVEARDTGHPVGLLLDGLVTCEDGSTVALVSDELFATGDGVPARVLDGPGHGYMGDPANLLLYPRPHPLPEAGWLLDQPTPPAPFSELIFSAGTEAPAPAWYRFLLPPGATGMELPSPGEAQLFVDGEPVVMSREARTWTCALPRPDAPRRVAALRIASIAGYAEGAAILAPITFAMGPGQIGLGSWDELGLPHYCGGVLYSKEVHLTPAPGKKTYLDLGRVRGTAEVAVNGAPCGVRIWHPYLFDISNAVKEGPNHIEIRVFNTLGPHFATGHPSQHVYENHTKSGLLGPVTVSTGAVVEMELTKVSGEVAPGS